MCPLTCQLLPAGSGLQVAFGDVDGEAGTLEKELAGCCEGRQTFPPSAHLPLFLLLPPCRRRDNAPHHPDLQQLHFGGLGHGPLEFRGAAVVVTFAAYGRGGDVKSDEARQEVLELLQTALHHGPAVLRLAEGRPRPDRGPRGGRGIGGVVLGRGGGVRAVRRPPLAVLLVLNEIGEAGLGSATASSVTIAILEYLAGQLQRTRRRLEKRRYKGKNERKRERDRESESEKESENESTRKKNIT